VGAQETAGGAHQAEIDTAAVVLDGVILMRVRGASSLPPGQRARAIENRLRSVAANPTVAVDSFRAVDGEGMTRILAGQTVIMTVTDADASLEQAGRVELATVHIQRLREAVIDYRAARSPGALRRAAVRGVVGTLIALVTIVALRWFWRWVDGLLTRRYRGRVASVGIQSFEVLRAEQIWRVLQTGLLGFRALIILAIALTYVGFMLALLPWTRGLSQGMLTFALDPLQVMASGLVANIPSLVFLTVLFVSVRLGLRLIRLFFDAVGQGAVTLANFEPEWADPTYKIARIAVVAFALVVAYPYIPGSDTDAFKGVSLFIGVLFSLGSSTAIANIIAGYMLTYRRALKIGDRVKIGETIGDVVETRLQATHLRSFKNEEVIIPNSQILAAEVLNYSSLARDHGLILHTEVGIGYDTPWRQVEAMLFAAAERTEGLSGQARPFILVKRLGDFAVTYELNVYCSNVKAMAKLYTALHRNILDVFNEHGVQIMTPAYEGDPPEPKIVPKDHQYAAPASAEAAVQVHRPD
jgi:small-conductance mechanosensitive channel